MEKTLSRICRYSGIVLDVVVVVDEFVLAVDSSITFMELLLPGQSWKKKKQR